MKIALAVLGLLMFVGGLLGGCSSATMKTTVIGEGGQDVHNIGLIGKQEAETTLYAGLAIVGAVLLGSAGVIDAIHFNGRRVTERADKLADKEAEDRKAMLRRLDLIVANSQTSAAPVRAATAKADTDFDAAIAAELHPPRSAPQPIRMKTPPPVR